MSSDEVQRMPALCGRCYSAPLVLSGNGGSAGWDRAWAPDLVLKPLWSPGLHPREDCSRCSDDRPVRLRTSRGHDELRYPQTSPQALPADMTTGTHPHSPSHLLGLLSSQFHVQVVPALLCNDRTSRAPSSIHSSRDASARGSTASSLVEDPLPVHPVPPSTHRNLEHPVVASPASKRVKFLKKLSAWLGLHVELRALQPHLTPSNTPLGPASNDPPIFTTTSPLETSIHTSHRNLETAFDRTRLRASSPQADDKVTRASSATAVEESELPELSREDATGNTRNVLESVAGATGADEEARALPTSEEDEPPPPPPPPATSAAYELLRGAHTIYVSSSIRCICSSVCSNCGRGSIATSLVAEASSVDPQSTPPTDAGSVSGLPTPSPSVFSPSRRQSGELSQMGGRFSSERSSISNVGRRRSNLSHISNMEPSLLGGTSTPSISQESLATERAGSTLVKAALSRRIPGE